MKNPLPASLRLFAVALSLALGWATSARADYIRSFHSDIRIQKDTTMDVEETIAVDFEDAQRHGIYRDIPVKYERTGGNYTIYLDLKSVTDGDGNTLKYEVSRQWRNLHIKIGDADKYVSGVQTYKLRYYVRRAVNWFDGKPEFYWNVMGNDWPYRADYVTANLYGPSDVDLSGVKFTSFAGPRGTTNPGQMKLQGNHIAFWATNMEAGSDLTLVAGFPEGALVKPSQLQTILWFLADWWPMFFLPLAALVFVISKYMKSGRDVDGGMAAGVEWNPPKELSPAEVGTLVDERCDMQDIVSTLVDLAARGHLVIEETKVEKFLFLSSKDYVFTRLPVTHDIMAEPLMPHESEFLRGVFGSAEYSSGSQRVTLSSLKNNFYTHLPTIRGNIYQALTDKGLFNGNPETVRNTYIGAGVALVVLGICAGIFGAILGMISYGIGCGIAGFIVAFSAKAMPSKTAKGSRLARECFGFQRFVSLAEKDRIAVLAKEDPTIFGRLLPYAMVLGVADQWAFAFKDLMSEPPNWYVPYGYGHGYMFSSNAFVNDLGNGMNSMGSTFQSQPSSSGGSGGSGFSGGGGGGGFGGGGGGSW